VVTGGDASPLGSLGGRIKRFRQRSGKSQREVARRTGVSPSFLSQLERGRAQPSVATLYALAQFLEVSIDEFFTADGASEASPPDAGEVHPVRRGAAAGTGRRPRDSTPRHRSDPGALIGAWRRPTTPTLSLTRPGERHVLEMDGGVIWARLADNTGAGLDFIEVLYPPQASSTNGGRMLQHSGWEFGWLIEGELEITVGVEVLTLHAHEAIGFDSEIPHLFANRTDRIARGIWCVRHGR
jgi:transcriptional regulator with XRE-family HTH domain